MPELPEVEVTRQGIEPHINQQTITKVIVRHRQMRWPIPEEVSLLQDQIILSVKRRGKYLLINTAIGTLILHLGMSGSLRILPVTAEIKKHDHFELQLSNGQCLRLNDPRRFGAVLWQNWQQTEPLSQLASLGPEPLSDDFNAAYIKDKAKTKSIVIKNFIMDSKVVVGVGNIYANESLFLAGIHPKRPTNQVTEQEWQQLVSVIKQVLAAAIKQGGTTLKDFTNADGKPGYFVQSLNVYGRGGENCVTCGQVLNECKIGQRASVFCGFCQK
ncbi:DNA-formamidopyrimidine glycosylase [Saccharobesus litoralis]|uniref:Formamidopyrimidine-DNA glycosylase n=1 Tax=Saccharobesus litoralis TaxID=2172099 RepID=A0A2S0VRT5_9ALTE|nr:bifunctional DNA-formamidopyrimidine glycosylase/DNA-(apurinic or apyrimidinic site) lyase [Saccharobesus litoralis]AWB66919.1 DNA-formamidopyrimidine glycosylase [Saccharobesus litoralis]